MGRVDRDGFSRNDRFRLTVVSIWRPAFVHRRPRSGPRCWSTIRGRRDLLRSCPSPSWTRCTRSGRCYRSYRATASVFRSAERDVGVVGETKRPTIDHPTANVFSGDPCRTNLVPGRYQRITIRLSIAGLMDAFFTPGERGRDVRVTRRKLNSDIGKRPVTFRP